MIRSPFFYEGKFRFGNVDVCPGVRIGAHSYVNSGRIESDTYIGRYCSIGYDVHLGVGTHDIKRLSTSPFFGDCQTEVRKLVRPGVAVELLNDVWCGSNVVILPGVQVGNGAVIGAGTVVTRSVPHYAIVVGNPARVLKYRFEEKIIERLLRARWWDLADDVLSQLDVDDVEAALDAIEALPESELVERLDVVHQL